MSLALQCEGCGAVQARGWAGSMPVGWATITRGTVLGPWQQHVCPACLKRLTDEDKTDDGDTPDTDPWQPPDALEGLGPWGNAFWLTEYDRDGCAVGQRKVIVRDDGSLLAVRP